MKLRIIKVKNKIEILCANGSIINATPQILSSVLTNFKSSNEFKGEDNYWSSFAASMEDVKGQTLAYIDDREVLVVVSEETFLNSVMQDGFVSVSEYAEMHNKSKAMIKRYCIEGRIPGAEKHSIGWMIPKTAPYPERK